MDINFGFIFDDFFSDEVVEVPNKKKEQKAEVKKAAPTKKAAATKTEKDIKIKLPVEVVGRGFSFEYSKENETSVSGKALLEELASDVYGCKFLNAKDAGASYEEATNSLFLITGAKRADDDNIAVDASKPLVVNMGNTNCVIPDNEEAEEDEDELTVGSIKDKFLELYPEYKQMAGLSYCNATGIFVPVFNTVSSLTADTTVINVGGNNQQTEANASSEAVKDLLGEIKACDAGLEQLGDTYYLNFYKKYKGGNFISLNDSATSTAEPKKAVEVKYSLPCTLYIVNWNVSLPLTADMFDGKEKVTAKEVTEKMAETEAIFKDSSRKPDYLWREDSKTLSCMFVSGKKGAWRLPDMDDEDEEVEEPVHRGLYKLVRSETEYDEVIKRTTYFGNFCGSGEFFTFCKSHIGIFKKFNNRVELELNIPKIPKEVLDNIIQYFRSNLEREACVRILYNKGEFIVIEAEGNATKTSINYNFSSYRELMATSNVVAEIHSHNTMPAYFSLTDNLDEYNQMGVFGVIGDLQNESPSILFKAAYMGQSSYIPYDMLVEEV